MFTQSYPAGLRYSLQPTAPVDDFAALILKHDLLALGDAMQNPEPKYLVTEAWPKTGLVLDEAGVPHPRVVEPVQTVSWPMFPRDPEEWITEILHSEGLSVLGRTAVDSLTEKQVDAMYPSKANETWYIGEEGYRATMVGTRAVALMIGGQKVSENLDRIKGKPDIPDTLRWLLSPARAMSGDEREAYDQLRWERRQKLATSTLDPETRDRLLKAVYQEDRIHTTDEGEALVATRAFFPSHQIAAVAAEHPGVAELLAA